MTTSTLSALSTPKTFDSFSDLRDGLHFFSSNLLLDGEVVQISSSIEIKDSLVIDCGSLAGNEFRGNRECEYNIRKSIIWILNELAESVTLDSGYTVFAPQVFNMYCKRR